MRWLKQKKETDIVINGTDYFITKSKQIYQWAPERSLMSGRTTNYYHVPENMSICGRHSGMIVRNKDAM